MAKCKNRGKQFFLSPHDGAEAFAGDSVPALRLMKGDALVRDAMAVAVSSAHFLSSDCKLNSARVTPD